MDGMTRPRKPLSVDGRAALETCGAFAARLGKRLRSRTPSPVPVLFSVRCRGFRMNDGIYPYSRWREMDSNFRSPIRSTPVFETAVRSPLTFATRNRVRIPLPPAKSPLRTCFEQPTTHRLHRTARDEMLGDVRCAVGMQGQKRCSAM
jgi:hypothetical protein